MMMARPYFVALLCVALWCGVVFAQDEGAAPEPEPKATGDSESLPEQQPPKGMTDQAAPAAAPSTTTTTTSTEGTNAAGGEEASSSTDQSGAATLSVSLSSMMLATLLAKVYAH